MAISGSSSYIPTTNEFLSHWQLVNTNLGVGNEVTLAGGIGIADLTTLRNSLQAKRDELENTLNVVEIASATIKLKKQSLIERFQQFAAKVRSQYPGQPFEGALPDQPGLSDAESKFTQPMADVLSLWNLILASGATLTLVGGYDNTDFSDELGFLREEYITWLDAQTVTRVVRSERNVLQDEIYPILKQYRAALPGYFAAGSVYIDTMPRLTPLPGSTPDAVNASAVWDADETKARIEWEASDNAHLKEYEVRYTPGDDYDEDDEVVVATILPNAPRELLTDAGLTQEGASSSFKVYVMLTTGNEKGSATMVITRPVVGGG